jgi:hypothetical protein
MSALAALHPQFEDEFRKNIRSAELDRISSKSFQTQKVQLVTISILLKKHGNLKEADRQKLIDDVFSDSVKTKPKHLFRTGIQDFFNKVLGLSIASDADEADSIASTTTDTRFLSDLQGLVATEPLLCEIAARTVQLAHTYIQEATKKLVATCSHRAIHIQMENCKKQIHREAQSRLEQELNASRAELIQQMKNRPQADNLYVILF